jgi:hypothetical protein
MVTVIGDVSLLATVMPLILYCVLEAGAERIVTAVVEFVLLN